MDEKQKQDVVRKQLFSITQMNKIELIEKWRDLFGREPPNYGIKYMQRRLAYRIQELFYGGLPEHLQKEIICGSENPLDKKPQKNSLCDGVVLVRIWHGKRHEVTVRSSGYEYMGKMYRSLSAVAQKITGTHWNGNRFFSIKEK